MGGLKRATEKQPAARRASGGNRTDPPSAPASLKAKLAGARGQCGRLAQAIGPLGRRARILPITLTSFPAVLRDESATCPKIERLLARNCVSASNSTAKRAC